MFLPVSIRCFDIWFLGGSLEQHNGHFVYRRFSTTKKPSFVTPESSNKDPTSSHI